MSLIYFLLLLVSSTVASNCVDKCGDVLIQYPFGIGDGCYHNAWYEVQCKNSTSDPKFIAFLPKIKKEVVQIDLPRRLRYEDGDRLPSGSLRIKTGITSMGCSERKGGNLEEILDVTGSPFYISGNNSLVVLGCNSKATLKHVTPRIVGCVSTCDKFTDILPSSNPSCNGFGCCNATIPENSQVIGVILDKANASRTKGGCEVAYLTDKFEESHERLEEPEKVHERNDTVLQLDWRLHTTNLSYQNSLRCLDYQPHPDDFVPRPCICITELATDEINWVMCACNHGFEGNPFAPDKCQDIDECAGFKKDGHDELCKSGTTCTNLPGNYQCVAKKDRTYLIYIGISIGLGVVMVGLCIWLYRLIKKHRKRNLRKKFFKRNGGLLLEQELTSKQGCVEKTILFGSKELEKATEKFSSSRVLGHGGQGTVFKGMLGDGRIVAVKQSIVVDEAKLGEFINELVILSQINHRNIVKLLGCCLETEVPLLVYEFISNGNLSEHLHNEMDDETVTSWEMRLKIAIDVAGALSYLHSAATSPIYHRDIKSTNIMLDDKFRAKLSDFGTSRTVTEDQTHLTTVVLGTAGYVDPEYYQSSHFTEKSDVYSFGVVLAELITGEKPFSLQRSSENRTLATLFLRAMKENRLNDIVDSRIRDGCKLDQVTAMENIANTCLHLKGERRPTMREVSMELEMICSGSPQQEFHDMVTDEQDEIVELQ